MWKYISCQQSDIIHRLSRISKSTAHIVSEYDRRLPYDIHIDRFKPDANSDKN